MKKGEKAEKAEAAVVHVPQPAHRMTMKRDELYRLVNATRHAYVELIKDPTFAIRNRANAYRDICVRMDQAYMQLLESGMDAEFDVQFFLREKPKAKPVDEAPAKN